jgi:hypothetical protein
MDLFHFNPWLARLVESFYTRSCWVASDSVLVGCSALQSWHPSIDFLHVTCEWKHSVAPLVQHVEEVHSDHSGLFTSPCTPKLTQRKTKKDGNEWRAAELFSSIILQFNCYNHSRWMVSSPLILITHIFDRIMSLTTVYIYMYNFHYKHNKKKKNHYQWPHITFTELYIIHNFI